MFKFYKGAVMLEAVKIINDNLNRYTGRKKVSETNLYICCPFHGERTPSLGIYLVEGGKYPYGTFHCFGCGTSGTWNKLAKELNLGLVDESDYKQRTTSSNIKELEKQEQRLLGRGSGVELPFGINYKKSMGEWRTISGSLMEELGCKVAFDAREKCSYVVIPIYVGTKLVTYIKARWKKKKGAISYIVSDATCVRDEGLFPYNKVKSMIKDGTYKHVLLVEGPRDALYLIDRGVPALAILGTNMWGVRKQRKVLRLLNRYGCTPIVCMDADKVKANGIKPGQKAQREIYRSLKKDTDVKKINLEKLAKKAGLEELDPASLSDRDIKNILKVVLR